MRLCNELGVLYNDLAGACRQGFDIVCFHVDWGTRYVTCLGGRQSASGAPATTRITRRSFTSGLTFNATRRKNQGVSSTITAEKDLRFPPRL
jgi:hypothetical protein